MVGCATVDSGPDEAARLWDVPVRIVSMEPATRSMEILKATAVNPETGEETSRFAATWTRATTFVSTEDR